MRHHQNIASSGNRFSKIIKNSQKSPKNPTKKKKFLLLTFLHPSGITSFLSSVHFSPHSHPKSSPVLHPSPTLQHRDNLQSAFLASSRRLLSSCSISITPLTSRRLFFFPRLNSLPYAFPATFSSRLQLLPSTFRLSIVLHLLSSFSRLFRFDISRRTPSAFHTDHAKFSLTRL